MSDRQVMLSAAVLFLTLLSLGPLWSFPQVERALAANAASVTESAQSQVRLTWTGRDGYLWVPGRRETDLRAARQMATQVSELQGVRAVRVTRATSARFAAQALPDSNSSHQPVPIPTQPQPEDLARADHPTGAERAAIELRLVWDKNRVMAHGIIPAVWRPLLARVGLGAASQPADAAHGDRTKKPQEHPPLPVFGGPAPAPVLTHVLQVLLPWLEGERLLSRGELSITAGALTLAGEVVSSDALIKIQDVLRPLPIEVRLTVEPAAAVARRLAELAGSRPIRFARGSARLTATSRTLLYDVAQLLEQYPGVPVQIVGYADARGSAPSNLRLSRRRAEAVKRGLLARGIASARLFPVGRGERRPRADSGEYSGQRHYRRVELLVRDLEEPAGTGPAQGAAAAVGRERHVSDVDFLESGTDGKHQLR